jgi:hypothetical protein
VFENSKMDFHLVVNSRPFSHGQLDKTWPYFFIRYCPVPALLRHSATFWQEMVQPLNPLPVWSYLSLSRLNASCLSGWSKCQSNFAGYSRLSKYKKIPIVLHWKLYIPRCCDDKARPHRIQSYQTLPSSVGKDCRILNSRIKAFHHFLNMFHHLATTKIHSRMNINTPRCEFRSQHLSFRQKETKHVLIKKPDKIHLRFDHSLLAGNGKVKKRYLHTRPN